jgi:2-keto-4-pentenoate hydratase/2-oxohepta-3-ene-1,7-dioic acid hydratase in catechol pathway/catechol 2,3-dioxygenase-like lactoylglutathione lyase family enzyme
LGAVLAHVESDGRRWWAYVTDQGLIPFGQYASTADLLQAASRHPVPAIVGTPISPSDVRFLSPVTPPARIICQGANYADHRREGGYSSQKPAFNMIFTKADSSLCGAADAIVRPARVALLDYEAELGLVVGTEIRGPLVVAPGEIHRYVGGLVVANDVSARDVQIPEEQWVKGKSFRTFCPTGPYLYLLDESDGDLLDRLELRLWVNGELRQSASTADLLYKPYETLTELSGVMDLTPGDLILTGTPGGVAIKAPPRLVRLLGQLVAPDRRMKAFIEGQAGDPAYLQPGDVVRASIFSRDGRVDLGTQVNRVVDADPAVARVVPGSRRDRKTKPAMVDPPLREAPSGSPAPARFQHAVFYVRDLAQSQAFYQDIFDVQFSARNHPDSSAAMRLVGHTMMFFSFGHYHHDICFVQNPRIAVDNEEWLHFTVRARTRPAFEAIRDRASARGLKVSAGRVLPIYGAGAEDALHFRDPDGHVVEVVASPMPAEV